MAPTGNESLTVPSEDCRRAGGEVSYEQELTSSIDTVWIGKPLHFFETLDSTNLRAKLEAEAGAESGTLIVADEQTAGRGRRGRGWESPKGKNVYFTLLLRPNIKPDRASMLTLVMALAVAQGIERTCQLSPQIKWPNDIVLNGKKICGILTEMSLELESIAYVVIGVGINVELQNFSDQVRATATCLREAIVTSVNRAKLIAEILKSFEELCACFLKTCDMSILREDYITRLVNQDRQVRVLDPKGEYIGTARGINDRGELLVELEDGRMEVVYAGEVSVRGLYGYT